MGEREIAREIEARLNADPAIQDLLRSFIPRDPRYRYWETPDGWQFHYTTERMGDGKYASAIYAPRGKGARSGRKNVTQLSVRREVHHATRKAAKARALKLYRDHDAAHPEWSEAREKAREDRNRAVRLRWYKRTGRWPESWGPVPA